MSHNCPSAAIAVAILTRAVRGLILHNTTHLFPDNTNKMPYQLLDVTVDWRRHMAEALRLACLALCQAHAGRPMQSESSMN